MKRTKNRNPQSAIRKRRAARRRAARRGILLLVVLGLLTLFLFVGTAFVVSSNQYRMAEKSFQKIGAAQTVEENESDFLYEVLDQLVRDTSNQNSALRFHSLLRDLYGTEGIVVPASQTNIVLPDGTNYVPAFRTNGNFDWAGNNITFLNGGTAANWTGGQFLEFSLADAYEDMLGVPYSGAGYSNVDNYYNGLLVTFLSGPAKGCTTRIVGYIPPIRDADTGAMTQPPMLRVMNFLAQGKQAKTPQEIINEMNANPPRILINGRPFNGAGVGYNLGSLANTARLTGAEQVLTSNGLQDLPIALMPSSPFFNPDMVDDWNTVRTTPGYFPQATNPANAYYNPGYERQFEGLGGSDESYDAPDFQNMFLAWSPPNPVESAWKIDGDTVAADQPASLGATVIPSFHRPALINYWAEQLNTNSPKYLLESPLGTDSLNANLLRKIMLRPNMFDHPNFTGSNPDLAGLAPGDPKFLARMVYGPWDVDNDQDGVRESVWIDFGAPPIMGPTGRMVKPLAAIMVLDMDGRLNVNAHGTGQMARAGVGQPDHVSFAGGVQSNNAPRGQAYGPAEISLEPVVQNKFDNILTGRGRDLDDPDDVADQVYAGRYGQWNSGDNEPGVDDKFDLAAQLKMQGYPSSNQALRSNFATMPDLRARYSLGLNGLGQAITDFTGNGGEFGLLTEDNPYELNLSESGCQGAGSGVDNPFTYTELERLLRAFDVDAGTLDQRLYEILRGQAYTSMSPADLAKARTMLTTASFDLPEPGFQLPEWVYGPSSLPKFSSVMNRLPVNATYADLIEYRLRAAQSPVWNVADDAANPARANFLRWQMAQLIAPEMMAGLKLDLNRPLGNGRDDNGNGVVDEPGEYFDTNTNGQFDSGEEGAFWVFDRNRLENSSRAILQATAPANKPLAVFEDPLFASYWDSLDRDGDGQITNFERGDYLPDNDNNGIADAGDGGDGLTYRELVELHNFRRQLLARHIYTMAMAVADPVSSGDQKDLEARARKIAQWAINLVDFRDPDNIMTAFEYDVDPFDADGWAPDGNLETTDDHLGLDGKPLTDDDTIVWGLERPEVLMEETLAWHDRATEDRGAGFEDAVTDENGDGKMTGDDEGTVGTQSSPGNDTDYDQRVRPFGATFVEIYNPNEASPGANADTHLVDPTTGQDYGVDLSAVDELQRTSPVWRINVRKTVDYNNTGGSPTLSRYVGGPDRDPDDPNYRVQPQVADRTVYFTNFDPEQYRTTYPWDDDGVAFFSSLVRAQPNIAPQEFNLRAYVNTASVVRPGSYLVVGSGKLINGNYEARIGAKKRTATGATRAIVLNPQAIGVQRNVGANTTPAISLRDSNGTLSDQAGYDVFAYTRNHVAVPNSPVSEEYDIYTTVSIIDSVHQGGNNELRHFSVSEPATGYPDRVFNSAWTGTEGYDDPAGVYKPTIDIPLDNQRSSVTVFGVGNTVDNQRVEGAKSTFWFRQPWRSPTKVPLRKDNDLRLTLPEKEETSVRTIPGYSWLYLQRLANPLLPWNPAPDVFNGTPGQVNPKHDSSLPVNPYRTVDSMGVNVTVFNGQDETERRHNHLTGDFFDYNNAYAMRTFASLQRGRFNLADLNRMVGRISDTQGALPYSSGANTGYRNMPVSRAVSTGSVRNPHQANGDPVFQVPQNLWGEEQVGQAARFGAGGGGRLRAFGMWLNRAGKDGDGFYRSRGVAATHYMNSVPDSTLGFLNEPFQNPNLGNNIPDGDPRPEPRAFLPTQPFPTITWNNRPFANEGEILQVPCFRSSQLLKVYSFQLPGKSEQYKGDVVSGTYPKDGSRPQNYPELTVDAPYAHLPNFFRTENEKTNRGIAGLYRVLDLVDVNSRYAGTEEWLNPTSFGSSQVASVSDPRYQWQPPFNHVSKRRDPGLVNINTIASGDIWHGIFHGSAKRDGRRDGHPVVDDDDFASFRRGFGVLNQGPTQLDANSPTLFANPFRAANTGNFVPLGDLRRKALDTTLLRSSELPNPLAGSPDPSGDPLFTAEVNQEINDAFVAQTPNPFPNYQYRYRDTDRNSYFRYAPISRLSSMTTTRSNVFAVWITIGFFEVEEAAEVPQIGPFKAADPRWNGSLDLYNRIYPDGYTFGREAGIDTGEIKRVRLFAFVDRTIPVGFQPGADNNTRQTVRLLKQLE